jgi:type II secretory ATPase GspE/PulE/Tfp pilus assembly ATPase PilB-like protein
MHCWQQAIGNCILLTMDAPHLELATAEGVQRISLDEGPVTIGRHGDNKMVLADKLASRHHCVIERAGNRYRVRDLKSANGTRLNGQLVFQEILSPGDQLSIGGVRIQFVDPNAPEASNDDPPDLSHFQSEEIETLGIEDVVEAEPGEAGLNELIGQSGAIGDYEATLRRVAEALPDRSFSESDIAMVNARGQVVHAAGQSNRRDGNRQEAVEILRLVLLVCFRSHASDIHLEPKHNEYQLRVRVDGTMVDVVRFTSDMGVKLTALVKILCDIDVTKRDIIQEGHFGVHLPDRHVDYRISFAPTVFGQKLVIRVLDTANTPLKVNNLELPQWMLKNLSEAIKQAAGMVLVCGPTGSGKTTSLYALVRSIDVDRRNVVTIEDPVEIQLEGVTQIPVNEEGGKGFSALLRSVLRQDPDVILVGEIRDSETARIAMQASMTGHLVFSTIHTKDTIGAIFRLLDLGVEPYLVAQGLYMVLAQRLVRRLCPYCKRAVHPMPEQLAKMGPAGDGVKRLYVPQGCPRCLGTGYSGRRAFFELLTATDALKELILTRPSIQEIQKSLAGDEFIGLLQGGYELVAEGVVAFDEIEHAVGR